MVGLWVVCGGFSKYNLNFESLRLTDIRIEKF